MDEGNIFQAWRMTENVLHNRHRQSIRGAPQLGNWTGS
jgi:hypothetical protein